MHLFRKKVTLVNTNRKEEMESKKKLLADAGLWVHTWETEPVPVTGQGAGLRPSDWAGKTMVNKDEQRIVYHLEVLKDDQYQAMKILMEADGVDLQGE
ncbi:MAG TPA: hypothetical protein DGX96_03385 [Lachnospiraceae bacterium]|jgi:hypothetical protein|nr:hypothetical protein [Lachnospiraceae bacterium]